MPLPATTDTGPVAFHIGQVDALACTLLASHVLYTADMRAALALRWLTRAWAQYRKDRSIARGAALVGAECTAARNAFLVMLERALPARDGPLVAAIRMVRQIAIRPIAGEADIAAATVAASESDLDAVLAALSDPRLPRGPLERLSALVERFRYSRGEARDPLSATAHTPCWAINLAATAQGHGFGLSEGPLPFPGLVQRRLFRADRTAHERRHDARESLLGALHETARDIARIPRAAEAFAARFPDQRRNSRLCLAWMLLFGIGALTSAQLARALPATKAGAAKLLRQLEAQRMVRSQGPFAPFACTLHLPAALPDWRYRETP